MKAKKLKPSCKKKPPARKSIEPGGFPIRFDTEKAVVVGDFKPYQEKE